MNENNNDLKKDEKASLSCSKNTREKVRAYIEKRQQRERYRVTHDLVIEEAIDCLDRHDADQK